MKKTFILPLLALVALPSLVGCNKSVDGAYGDIKWGEEADGRFFTYGTAADYDNKTDRNIYPTFESVQGETQKALLINNQIVLAKQDKGTGIAATDGDGNTVTVFGVNVQDGGTPYYYGQRGDGWHFYHKIQNQPVKAGDPIYVDNLVVSNVLKEDNSASYHLTTIKCRNFSLLDKNATMKVTFVATVYTISNDTSFAVEFNYTYACTLTKK